MKEPGSQWYSRVGNLADYSGGPATDSHRFPYSASSEEERKHLSSLMDIIGHADRKSRALIEDRFAFRDELWKNAHRVEESRRCLWRSPVESTGIGSFGASAPLKDLLKKFGFTPEHVVVAPREHLRPSR